MSLPAILLLLPGDEDSLNRPAASVSAITAIESAAPITTIVSTAALLAIAAVLPLSSLRAFYALRAIAVAVALSVQAIDSVDAFTSVEAALGSIRSIGSLGPVRALDSLDSFRSLGSLDAFRSLAPIYPVVAIFRIEVVCRAHVEISGGRIRARWFRAGRRSTAGSAYLRSRRLALRALRPGRGFKIVFFLHDELTAYFSAESEWNAADSTEVDQQSGFLDCVVNDKDKPWRGVPWLPMLWVRR